MFLSPTRPTERTQPPSPFAGYEVRNIKSDAQGCIDLTELDRAMTANVAGLMLTNPNTLGILSRKSARSPLWSMPEAAWSIWMEPI